MLVRLQAWFFVCMLLAGVAACSKTTTAPADTQTPPDTVQSGDSATPGDTTAPSDTAASPDLTGGGVDVAITPDSDESTAAQVGASFGANATKKIAGAVSSDLTSASGEVVNAAPGLYDLATKSLKLDGTPIVVNCGVSGKQTLVLNAEGTNTVTASITYDACIDGFDPGNVANPCSDCIGTHRNGKMTLEVTNPGATKIGLDFLLGVTSGKISYASNFTRRTAEVVGSQRVSDATMTVTDGAFVALAFSPSLAPAFDTDPSNDDSIVYTWTFNGVWKLTQHTVTYVQIFTLSNYQIQEQVITDNNVEKTKFTDNGTAKVDDGGTPIEVTTKNFVKTIWKEVDGSERQTNDGGFDVKTNCFQDSFTIATVTPTKDEPDKSCFSDGEFTFTSMISSVSGKVVYKANQSIEVYINNVLRKTFTDCSENYKGCF